MHTFRQRRFGQSVPPYGDGAVQFLVLSPARTVFPPWICRALASLAVYSEKEAEELSYLHPCCFLVPNDSYGRHFPSSGRESSSPLTSSRPSELWGDAPCLRPGCMEKERRGSLNLTLTTQNPDTFRREHHYVPFLPQGSALKISTGFFSSALFIGEPWWLPGVMKPPHFSVPS